MERRHALLPKTRSGVRRVAPQARAKARQEGEEERAKGKASASLR